MKGFNLQRFVEAQDANSYGLPSYEKVLEELRSGEKRSHWIWYIFPQIKGLGHSYMNSVYCLSGVEESAEYFKHPILGERLKECLEILLSHKGKKSVLEIMGGMTDALKLRSCVTLFWIATREPIFKQVIDDLFYGVTDDLTRAILKRLAERDKGQI